ncbi:hypothetical protein GCM10009839_70820 [Catenulispora yoronensis]|uniref:DUF4351 domain-containing protein n=2 Tax=Catenulispora yoronensis TaxID=450799 RepID=A0ABP5GP89_9ACTN
MVGSSREATFRVLGLDVPAPDTLSVISDDVTEIRPGAAYRHTAHDPAELTLVGLEDTPAGAIWRQMMTLDSSFYRSSFSRMLRDEGRAEGVAEGRAEGVAEGLITAINQILDRREIRVSQEQRALYSVCSDADQLNTWLDRAITATTAAEIFDVD